MFLSTPPNHMFPPFPFEISKLDNIKDWLLKLRKHHSHNSDIWELCRHWETVKYSMLKELNSGRYEFDPLQRIETYDGTYLSLWSSRDMIALKILALAVSECLPDLMQNSEQTSCYHLKGSGGLKQAVRLTHEAATQHTYVFRTDIQGYYESVRFDVLMDSIAQYVTHPVLLTLIKKALHRTETMGGIYYDYHTKGLPKGSPLSPILGAIALLPLDQPMRQRKDIFYARFMDDWVVLTHTKTALRRVIKLTHQILGELHLTLHPLKTYIGKISHGFNFLGYYMNDQTLLPSKETIRRFHERTLVLYEHPTEPMKRLRHKIGRDTSDYYVNERTPKESEVKEILTSISSLCNNTSRPMASQRIRRYIDQWARWVRVGLMSSTTFIQSSRNCLPSLFTLWSQRRLDAVV